MLAPLTTACRTGPGVGSHAGVAAAVARSCAVAAVAASWPRALPPRAAAFCRAWPVLVLIRADSSVAFTCALFLTSALAASSSTVSPSCSRVRSISRSSSWGHRGPPTRHRFAGLFPVSHRLGGRRRRIRPPCRCVVPRAFLPARWLSSPCPFLDLLNIGFDAFHGLLRYDRSGLPEAALAHQRHGRGDGQQG